MESWLLENATPVRLVAFFAILLVMGLWEWRAPCRKAELGRLVRWPTNLGVVFLNSFVVKLLFPVTAIAYAAHVQSQGHGLLALWGLDGVWGVVLAIVLLDGIIYLQHVMVHAVPMFWRLHQVHHADTVYDVTTGARFHPIEICLSMGIKLAAIHLLGPAPVAVLLFEVILNGMAMFNHANIQLPQPLDRLLRSLLVTPDMHRVHHSVHGDEANSNFGFNLSIWDRLMGTYRTAPRDGQVGMTIGLEKLRGAQTHTFLGILQLPFRATESRYAINRRGLAKREGS
uniref:Putative sterol desaturase-related protein, fatty acid hydroxylase superfamily n=1 Tax=Magnetococcus massalia (strain MO-1) TaxID=451514 RepID=A0A1S7LEJ6_MAGMO|nr:Putative sterol desaturase-related protein, fatty acid hydroxylase superfamily [Candidatus Magnetococcus massalia]